MSLLANLPVPLLQQIQKTCSEFLQPDWDEDLKEQILTDLIRGWLKKVRHEQLLANRYDWEFRARPEQLPPPGKWLVWFLRAGRAFGKTRAGGEWIRKIAHDRPGVSIALVGRTLDDVFKVMLHGRSGIFTVAPPYFMPKMEKGVIYWPNGSEAHIYSSEVPNALRGPQHEIAWLDEVAAYRNVSEVVDTLMMNMRDGRDPRILMTTTPRPLPRLVKLQEELDTVVVTGSTYDNRSNLPKAYLDMIRRRYEGTRLGLQEVYAQQLLEAEYALWHWETIENNRILDKTAAYEPEIVHEHLHIPLLRCVVAIDPAVTDGEDSDESGILVTGMQENEDPAIGLVLEDASGRYSPKGVAERAISAYHKWNADGIVAEVNNGGDWIEEVVRSVDPSVPYETVHASVGKRTRAEPVSALYEQNRVKHVGSFPELEMEMVSWEPDGAEPSPSRMDAMVWGFNALKLIEGDPGFEAYSQRIGTSRFMKGYM